MERWTKSSKGKMTVKKDRPKSFLSIPHKELLTVEDPCKDCEDGFCVTLCEAGKLYLHACNQKHTQFLTIS